MPPTVEAPDELLDDPMIATLRAGYDPQSIGKVLSETISGMYGATSAYLNVIGQEFYGLPGGMTQPPSDKLSAANRERCLVALLASRGADFTLAMHVYLAMMEAPPSSPDPIKPSELANIIFLAGVYTGADNLTRGLITLQKTLGVLRKNVLESPDHSQGAVLGALKVAFRVGE